MKEGKVVNGGVYGLFLQEYKWTWKVLKTLILHWLFNMVMKFYNICGLYQYTCFLPRQNWQANQFIISIFNKMLEKQTTVLIFKPCMNIWLVSTNIFLQIFYVKKNKHNATNKPIELIISDAGFPCLICNNTCRQPKAYGTVHYVCINTETYISPNPYISKQIITALLKLPTQKPFKKRCFKFLI